MFLIASTVTGAAVLLVIALIAHTAVAGHRYWRDEEALIGMKTVRRASARRAA